MQDGAQAGTDDGPERTWVPRADSELPDLTALPGVSGVGTPPARQLVAVQLDGPDLALVRSGLALRRRGGGPDEGWHLDLPVPAGGNGADEARQGARDGVHRPLGGDHLAPPDDLRRILEGHVPGAADLAAVAEVRTDRVVHDLRAPDGRVLAELVDDRVEARSLPAGTGEGPPPVAWRGWTLVVVDGDPALLPAADRLVAGIGVPRDVVSREARDRLADRLASQLALAAEVERAEPTATGPAREVVRARLVAQATALLRHDAGMRGDAPDSVHQARVACRRLRAALATFRPVVDRDRAEALRTELRWVARSLGGARDAEVAHGLLAGLLDAQVEPTRSAPERDRLAAAFGDAEHEAREAVAEVLGSERYLAMLEELGRFVAAPPWTDEAARPAADVLLPRLRTDWKRLRRRVAAAEAAAANSGPEAQPAYDERLHAARKAAKRLRYACEALEPVWGGGARRLRKAARGVTQVLGERQDTTVTRERLVAVADEAAEHGESAFGWGRLHGLEEARATEREHRFWERTWPAARRKRLRRWLRG